MASNPTDSLFVTFDDHYDDDPSDLAGVTTNRPSHSDTAKASGHGHQSKLGTGYILTNHRQSLGSEFENAEPDPKQRQLPLPPPKLPGEFEINITADDGSGDFDAARPQPGERGRHLRRSGDLEAARRPITTKPDEIDILMVRMKAQGSRNQEIADHIRSISDGTIDYDVKSIGTRIMRIKQMQVEEAESLLDSELTDWHGGEDEALLLADEMALTEIHTEIERKRARRWECTARYLQKTLKKDLPYSAKSCQKRFAALQDGTSRIPPELDDEPEKRLIERDEKKLARIQRLRQDDEDKQIEREQRRLVQDRKKLEKIEAQKARLEAQATLINEKANAALLLANRNATDMDEERRKRDEGRQAFTQLQRDTRGSENPEFSDAMVHDSAAKPAAPLPNPVNLYQHHDMPGVDNARQKMSVDELQELCRARGLTKGGTKPSILRRLDGYDFGLSDAALNILLRERHCATGGTRREQLRRLRLAEVAGSNWGKRNPNELLRARIAMREPQTGERRPRSGASEEETDGPTKRARGNLNNTG